MGKKDFSAINVAPPVNRQISEATQERPTKEQVYRFSLKLPIEHKAYLQEMSWRSRTSITDYLARLVQEDMERHPEWRDTIDILNT